MIAALGSVEAILDSTAADQNFSHQREFRRQYLLVTQHVSMPIGVAEEA